MHRCLQLAKQGGGSVAPNPMVGAVLVYNDRIIGEGYHKQYGQAHAEVNCINSVANEDKGLISKSTLYVSLEPCAHHGKTPPCADLIVANKIPHVIIACKDEFAAVNGKGIAMLEAKGVNVVVGVLEKDAMALNKRFFTYHKKKRPYIILKWAQSNDNKIAAFTDERMLISNPLSDQLVHKWRSEEAAILVGTNTAKKDNPYLTTRLWPGKNPVRIVIDNDLQLPVSLHLFDKSTKTIVFNTVKEEEGEMLSYYRIHRDKIVVQVLEKLYTLELQSVIIEGGAKLIQSFIDAGMWDEARVITNTGLTIGPGKDAPLLKNEVLQFHEQLLNDSFGYYTNGR